MFVTARRDLEPHTDQMSAPNGAPPPNLRYYSDPVTRYRVNPVEQRTEPPRLP